MTIALLSLTLFAWTAGLPAPVQDAALPFRVRTHDASAGEMQLALDGAAVSALSGMQHARFAALPLPDGTLVDAELTRLRVPALGFLVDGRPAPQLLEGLDLSVWMGTLAGDGSSQIALSASQAGLQGWVSSGGELFHLVSDSADTIWFVAERALEARGMQSQASCRAEDLPEYDEFLAKRPAVGGGTIKAGGSPALYQCKIALETDWQLHQVFNQNLAAETTYVTSLLTWVAYRYEEQIGTQLTFPYIAFYTSPNDPWHAQDVGGSSIDLLYEFQAAWQGGLPLGTDLAAFLSGAGLGGGVAWLPGLCNGPYNFSVSGNIDGDVTFPVQVSPSNWDFMVLAHEVGHNFGSPHSHDYCPPLDQCAPAGYFGGCQTQQVCTNQGTLMSYCHLCSGGLANVTTYFHPANATDMRAWVEATCLPLYCTDPIVYCTSKLNSLLCAPQVGWSGHPTLAGLDDFKVLADQVLNNQNGLMFYGGSPASTPYQGGTICVGAPIVRTAGQASGGNPPPSDCSGTLKFDWSHAGLSAVGLGAGTTVYAQFWYRDPLSVGGSGFTNGLSFTICN
jgi:hypothetical protein